jgi:DNA invertase Pin-like site-specific DNA recombinase
MRQYIYSRVSTDKQETENQLHGLRARYPTAEVVEEYISGTKVHKPELEQLLGRLVKGDTLVIAALDRLGRTAHRAMALLENLDKQGIVVVSVREGIDYSTSTGRMVAGMMLVIAQNERDIISERTKAALKRLQDSGVKLGRQSISIEERLSTSLKVKATLAAKRAGGWKPGPAPKVNSPMLERIKALRYEGQTMRQIAEVVGLSAGRICQLLKGA